MSLKGIDQNRFALPSQSLGPLLTLCLAADPPPPTLLCAFTLRAFLKHPSRICKFGTEVHLSDTKQACCVYAFAVHPTAKAGIRIGRRSVRYLAVWDKAVAAHAMIRC